MPKANPSSTTSRRAFALGTGAVAAIGLTAGAAATVARVASDPDAELIRLCRDHVANLHTYNAHGDIDAEDDPLWAAYIDTKDAISDAEPQTLAGMIAKAEAAKAEALQPDGSEDPMGGPAEDWAWDMVNDLLRLTGRA